MTHVGAVLFLFIICFLVEQVFSKQISITPVRIRQPLWPRSLDSVFLPRLKPLFNESQSNFVGHQTNIRFTLGDALVFFDGVVMFICGRSGKV